MFRLIFVLIAGLSLVLASCATVQEAPPCGFHAVGNTIPIQQKDAYGFVLGTADVVPIYFDCTVTTDQAVASMERSMLRAGTDLDLAVLAAVLDRLGEAVPHMSVIALGGSESELSVTVLVRLNSLNRMASISRQTRWAAGVWFLVVRDPIV